MTAQKQNANYDQFKNSLSTGVNTFKEPSYFDNKQPCFLKEFFFENKKSGKFKLLISQMSWKSAKNLH